MVKTGINIQRYKHQQMLQSILKAQYQQRPNTKFLNGSGSSHSRAAK